MVTITKTNPDLFFSFMAVVSSFQPCTLPMIRQGLKTAMGPVHSVQSFATQYGFVSFDKKTSQYSLSTEGERLVQYAGNLRNRFLTENTKLQCREPFSSLHDELSQKHLMTVKEIGEYLELKFPQKRKWDSQDKIDYAEAISAWLVLLQVAKREGEKIEFLGGEVKTAGIIYYPDMGKLMDRAIYDFLTEQFHTSKNIVDEPYELLKETNNARDDEKGELFESFIGCVFRRFGFSPRLKDGAREKSTNLTLTKSGGGDVALFSHFPIQSQKEIFHGCAIACEGKATGNFVGSKAVGQVRNFLKKIKEVYPQYLICPMIISQSTCGYDESGKRNAPPEVIHLTAKLILNLLDVQRDRLEQGLSLITPLHVLLMLEKLTKLETMEPDEKTVIEMIEKELENA
jgi:hypothetical protein